ncbi:MAG: HD domain-containing protein [Bacteroidota bacterium]
MNYRSLLNQYPLFSLIGKVADRYGLEVYVVGGFVRDLFLQRPCKDVDIVCVGDGVVLANHFAREIGVSKVAIFKKFGTAMLRWEEWQIEFVGARKESYLPNSRNPIVQPGSLKDDIFRRDFTINTLSLNLNQPTFGDLVDMCKGILDLDKGIIQTPLDPAQTFTDDPLRMLRAIRFANQLQFTILPVTWSAIQQEAYRMLILPQERITDEFNKILLSSTPDKGIDMLDQAGLLRYILPEMEALKKVDKIGQNSHKDNFKHTLQVVRNVANVSDNLWLRWAALLHDIAKPATKGFDAKVGFTFHGHEKLGAKMVAPIFRRLKLPLKQEMRYVKKLVRLHLRHIPLIENDVTYSAIRRFIHDTGDELEDLITLCRADITSHNPYKVKRYLSNFEKLEASIKAVEDSDRIRHLEPVIDGHQIMDIFQIDPCSKIGMIKSALKEAILEGQVSNQRDELYPYVLKKGKELGLTPKSG